MLSAMSAGTANRLPSTRRSSALVIGWPCGPNATTRDAVRVTAAKYCALILTSVSPTSSPAEGNNAPDAVRIESPCQLNAQPAVAADDAGPGSVAAWEKPNPAPNDVPLNAPSPWSGTLYGIVRLM